MDAVVESERNLVSKHHIASLSVENKRADVERDVRICLARSNSQARAETGIDNFPVQLTTDAGLTYRRSPR